MAAFYNTATLSYRDTSTNSNTVEGQLVKVLSAEKTAVTPTYGSTGTVTCHKWALRRSFRPKAHLPAALPLYWNW